MNDELHTALEIARRTHVFRLHDDRLGAIPPEIRHLPRLRELYVSQCGIEVVPDWIGELQSLTHLDLGGNDIAELPLALGTLPALRSLGLSAMAAPQMVDENLWRLETLEALVLTDMGLSDVPPAIETLPRLRMLDLGGNQIERLPATFSQLSTLTHLYLWGHAMHEIPTVLKGLRRLEVLDLSHTGAADLSAATKRTDLESAEELNEFVRLVGQVSDEQGELRELPDWVGSSWPRLRRLYLDGQRIEAFPSTLPAALEALYLTANGLEAFPQAILRLLRLEELGLRGNRLRRLPPRLQELRRLTYLDLTDNELQIPPEVLADTNSPQITLDYASRVQGPTRRLDQAKLLVVGEGSVGKTSLIRRLVSDDFSQHEQKTKGIEVTRWGVDVDGDDILLNVWDFGGQEIMHATHQFFLTRRSLYVLVVDARQGEEQNRIEYWLKLIQSFADTSPIIVIANKTDQSPMDVDARGLQAKYPSIVGILPVSCETGEGIGEVRTLLSASIEQMPHVRDLLPETFFEVKRQLEESDADYLLYSDYKQLCKDSGVPDSTGQEQLVGFLHDLGTVLCFRDDPRLSNTNILNPQWVTGGVYRLLNSNLAVQRKGLLTWEDVDEILDAPDYPRERRIFILDMMKRFELCYESDGIYLVPDLLTKQEPDTGSWDDALSFEVKYDVLPTSILSRLIVRMNPTISKGTVWRTGLVMTLDRNRALVKADREDAVVRIAVSGLANGRRGALTAIRAQLRAITATIPGLVGEERVPVPGHPGVWVPYGHLLNLEAAGRDDVTPQGLTTVFSVRELLDGVELPTDRADRRRVTSAEQAPRVSVTDASEAPPWSIGEAMRLGRFLLLTLLVVLFGFILADLAVGIEAAVILAGTALSVSLGIAVVMLLSSGRITEDGALDTLRHLLRRNES